MNRRTLVVAVASLAVLGSLAGAAPVKKAVPPSAIARPKSNTANSNTTDIRLTADSNGVAYYSNGKFKSVYRERITPSQVTQTFKFSVEAFTPNAEVPVTINGVQVATAVINPAGGGEFQFSASDNNPGNNQPMPDGFPRIRTGDVITIGNVTAVFR